MALIERLMHWGADPGDTEPPSFEPDNRHMSIHEFLAANILVIMGTLTVAQVKSSLAMTTADETDYDDLITLVNTAPQAHAKHRLMHKFDSVFILAENRNAGFSTPSEVRSKLGI